MSYQMGQIVTFLLTEYFGENIGKIGAFLYKWGPNPLTFISRELNLPLEKTKKAICLMIKLGFVSFQKGRSESIANYSLSTDKVLLIIRYCRYMGNIKRRYGNGVELIFEQIICQGIVRASDAILAAAKRKEALEEMVDFTNLRDSFVTLVTNQYIMRLPNPEDDKTQIPNLQVLERELYQPPEINIQLINEIRQNGVEKPLPDQDIYWRINFDKFHQDFRDSLIISAVKRRIDDNAAELMRLLIKLMYVRTEPWSEISNPIPIIEIKDILRKQNTHPVLIQYFDQYLNLLEDDQCRFIQRVSDVGAGQYNINMKYIFTEFAWDTVTQIIAEKFGSNAARIFRLVRSKKFIEAENIPPLAMMQMKDAKRVTYQLLEENFLQIRELRKSLPNSGPLKTFTLFHINIDQVIRMLLDLNYKCIYNIKMRRKHYTILNKPIIDKKQRADAIELDLKSKVPTDELEEIIAELITPAEKDVLNEIGKTIKNLNLSTLHLDETIFIFQLYLLYNAK